MGRYEIVQVLGRGAAAIVYLARDPIIDRLIALKTLRLDLAPEDAEEFRPRFLREARAAGRLLHPGIVTIFDAGEDRERDLLFIAMEYVEGSSLKQLIQSGTRFTPARVAELGYSLAQALDFAHKNGVVHRDIKPANIILTRDGVAKIADFGIARLAMSEHTIEGTILGTPSYMSPEQVSGGSVDGRSDIYSLGVVLFQLLTGILPFGAGSLTELSLKILKHPAPCLGDLLPALAPTFGPVLGRCLAKRPEDRFHSGAEFAAALGGLAGTLPARELGAQPPGKASPPEGGRPSQAPRTVDDVFALTPKTRLAVPQSGPPATMAPEVRRAWLARRLRVVLGTGVVLFVLIAAGYLVFRGGGRLGPWAPAFLAGHPSRAMLDTASTRLRGGDLKGAIEAAGAVLRSDPASQEAQAILDEARRRLALETAPANISVDFLSPVSRGKLVFTLDGEPLEEVSWDFTRKVIFGITRPGKGKVHALLTTPPGAHELYVALQTKEDGVVGEATFAQVFPAASRWTLEVAPGKRKGRVEFALRPRTETASAPTQSLQP